MLKSSLEWKRHICRTYFGTEETDIRPFLENVDGPRDRIVVHIPARSGSTRLKDKNVIDLCGVPLMAYTIAVAKALPVDRVIVDTDSPRYAAIAEKLGAEVPYLRPEELARDDVPPGLATYYLERYLLSHGYPLDAVIDMYPTSPFRNVAAHTRYVEILSRVGHCSTAFMPDLGLGDVYNGTEHLCLNSEQAADPGLLHYKPMANFVGRKVLGVEKRWFQYELIDNPVELVDIDTPEDLALASAIIENDLYDFGVAI